MGQCRETYEGAGECASCCGLRIDRVRLPADQGGRI
jgi:hypothetical protein